MKAEVERQRRDDLEETKRDALLKQRERQRYYRLRDTRTHEEREEALLKRREEKRTKLQREINRKEELKYMECTFQPRIFTKPEESPRRACSKGSHQVERSSSCGALARSSLRDQLEDSPPDSPGGSKLAKLLEKQFTLLRKLGDIDADAQQSRQRKEGRFVQTATGVSLVKPSEEELRDADMHIYRRQLEAVHALERLDMEILELPKDQLDSLLVMGFRLGLGEGVRQGIQSPRETQRKSLVETPRNNIRVIRSDDALRGGSQMIGAY
jgi:hypothetical protein